MNDVWRGLHHQQIAVLENASLTFSRSERDGWICWGYCVNPHGSRPHKPWISLGGLSGKPWSERMPSTRGYYPAREAEPLRFIFPPLERTRFRVRRRQGQTTEASSRALSQS